MESDHDRPSSVSLNNAVVLASAISASHARLEDDALHEGWAVDLQLMPTPEIEALALQLQHAQECAQTLQADVQKHRRYHDRVILGVADNIRSLLTILNDIFENPIHNPENESASQDRAIAIESIRLLKAEFDTLLSHALETQAAMTVYLEEQADASQLQHDLSLNYGYARLQTGMAEMQQRFLSHYNTTLQVQQQSHATTIEAKDGIIHTLQNKLSARSLRYGLLKSNVDELSKENSTLSKQLTEATSALKFRDEMVIGFKLRQGLLKQEKQNLEEQLHQAKATIEQLEADKEQMCLQLRDHEVKRTDDNHKHLEVLESQQEASRSDVIGVHADKERLTEDLQAMRVQLEKLEIEVKDISEIRTELERTRAANAELTENLSRSRETLQVANQKSSDLEQKLAEDGSQHSSSLLSMQRRIGSEIAQRKAAEERTMELKKEVQSLSANFERLQAVMKEKDEQTQAADKSAQTNAQVKSLQEEVARLRGVADEWAKVAQDASKSMTGNQTAYEKSLAQMAMGSDETIRELQERIWLLEQQLDVSRRERSSGLFERQAAEIDNLIMDKFLKIKEIGASEAEDGSKSLGLLTAIADSLHDELAKM